MYRRTHKQAFTLVELLVVISIIALLIGIALPAFRGARTAAKKTATQAVISAIEAGLQQYREERALGNIYPPSASDIQSGSNKGRIINPIANQSSGSYVPITGASLLVYALAGPDNRGTVGFRGSGIPWGESIGGPGRFGMNDPHDDGGNRVLPPRYGPYAEGKLLESIRPAAGKTITGAPIGLLNKDDVRPMPPANNPLFANNIDLTKDNIELPPIAQQLFFVDTFSQPILYYRARSAARQLVTTGGSIGVYDHRDNALLTGGITHDGINVQEPAWLKTRPFAPDPREIRGIANDGTGPFEQYIINPRTSAATLLLARPVNDSTCLLISAGPDGMYGTNDDVKNWGK